MVRTAIVAFLLLAGGARAEGWQALDGAPCPEFSARRWFNTQGTAPTAASLKGQVFLLVFFGVT
jgi:hypothetical protein